MAYWLAKTEPDTFSWQDLVRLGQDMWEGVRNYQASNFLGQMRPGDEVFIYHSGRERAVLGVAEVVSEPYSDPTAEDARWNTVNVKAAAPLKRPVTLREIKSSTAFDEFLLVKQSRLSVLPVSHAHWREILSMGEGLGRLRS